MKFSKSAIFYSPGKPVELKNIPVPELRNGEILVRNEYSTLCRSDLSTFCGKREEPVPTILGHEIVGRIELFGPGAPGYDSRGMKLNQGDRVSWAIFASDPDCELSQAGYPQKGNNLFKYGHQRLTDDSVLHGGLSEYTILRANTPLAKIDENVPVKVVSIINCAVATVAGSLRLAGDVSGRNILVSGAGMLGLIACAMLKTAGASKVDVLDINPDRLSMSRGFGADLILPADDEAGHSIRAGYGHDKPYHVVLEFSGYASAMQQTLEFLGIGGTAVWVGAVFPERDVSVNGEKMVRNILTIKGLHNYNVEDFLSAVKFIEEMWDKYPISEMVYDHFTLDDINEAFHYGLTANPLRVGIKLSE